MKRLDKESALKEHKQLRDQASRIEREIYEMKLKMAQIQRFYREAHDEVEGYDSMRQVRSAENELIRISRKLASFQPVLKHLSGVQFVQVSAENPRAESVNIIDKNVGGSVLELREEDSE